MILKIEEYKEMYGEITDGSFKRLRQEALRTINYYTTGVDGFRKLEEAFPTDEDDATTVNLCIYKLINLMFRYEQAEVAAEGAVGYDATENGLRGKVITSVSSGTESVSYATQKTDEFTIIGKAVADKAYWKNLLKETVWEHLSGVTDANGVNLLYMGQYPKRLV